MTRSAAAAPEPTVLMIPSSTKMSARRTWVGDSTTRPLRTSSDPCTMRTSGNKDGGEARLELRRDDLDFAEKLGRGERAHAHRGGRRARIPEILRADPRMNLQVLGSRQKR